MQLCSMKLQIWLLRILLCLLLFEGNQLSAMIGRIPAMKINTSYLFAGIAVVAIALWFVVNSRENSKAPPRAKTTITVKQTVPTVIYEARLAEQHKNRFSLFGRTEANREVDVKAKTAGLVIAAPITEGRRIAKGTVICRQGVDARQAVLDQMIAGLKSREADLNATKILVEKGFKSAIQLDSDKAVVDGARASVKQAEIELDNVNMRAPFAGVYEKQTAEIGDFLSPGQSCGRVIEMNPLVVTIDLTENQVGFVKLGQDADIELVTGESLTGKVRYIESKANASTRTFRTEISVPNPDYALKGGVTATVSIQTDITMAQHVPAKILSLDQDGSVGVRYLDINDIVRFARVKTIDEDANGMWVTGLPDETRIITQGQDFVAIGTQANPSLADYKSAVE